MNALGMNSLRVKLPLVQGMLGLIGIVLVFMVSWLGSQARVLSNSISEARNLSDQIDYSIAILVSQAGEDHPFSYQRLIEKFATLDNVIAIHIVDDRGVIIADNDQARIGESFADPMIVDALANEHNSQQVIGRTIVFVRPLHGQAYTSSMHDVLGVLWLEMDMTPSYQRAQGDILLTLLIGLAGFALIFYWYYRVTQDGLIDRLLVVEDGLRQVEKGDLYRHIKIGTLFGSPDEINGLADRFNRMLTSLRRQRGFEELTSRLAARFMNAPTDEMDLEIRDALRQLGKLFQADRSYIFEFSRDERVMNNTYEWCTLSVEPQIANLQNVPVDSFPWWMQTLHRLEVISVPRVSAMPPQAASEQAILAEQGIQSVLVAPMLSDAGLFGFIGFDSVHAERAWADEEIHLLSVVTGIIANTIVRQRSQQELQNQRDFALQVMNTVRQGLTVTDLEGRYEYVNPAFAQMLKRIPRELIGQREQDVFHSDDWQRIVDLQKGTGARAVTATARLFAADGTVVHSLVSRSPRIRDGQGIGNIAAVVDLTEQLAAEERLRQSEARNRAFLNAIPDLIFRLDRNGTFLDFKAGDDRQLVTSPSEILGRPITTLLPAGVAGQAAQAIQQALQTSTPQVFEYSLGHESGSNQHTYEARLVASGEDEVIAVIHDISERARLEQMKTDFINRASHELRTPLTTALLMTDLLDGEDSRPNEWKEYWQILKQELQRERLILEDVLMVGRLESGHYRISAAPTDLRPILEESLAAVRPQANQKQVHLSLEADDSLPLLLGSAEAFSHILVNLLSNAVKFSRTGGRVQVVVRADRGGASVRIADQGIGIPPGDLPHLTSRFFRAANATQQEIPGSGMGLYIVRSILEELGGKWKIHSRLDLGTTVSVWLAGT